jgi:hypothetical protein
MHCRLALLEGAFRRNCLALDLRFVIDNHTCIMIGDPCDAAMLIMKLAIAAMHNTKLFLVIQGRPMPPASECWVEIGLLHEILAKFSSVLGPMRGL